MSSAPLVRFTNVQFRYPIEGRRLDRAAWLLDGLHLRIDPGSRVGIVGDNGCGKSSIAKLILGLIEPDAGTVEVFGAQASRLACYPNLGYIGDPAHNANELGLPIGTTVGEMVRIFRRVWATSEPLIPVDELEEVLELGILRHQPVEYLSTGERKRLMAYLAFAKPSQLLLMDEPLDGLDRNIRYRVISLIQRILTGRRDMALLYISHSPAEIAAFTDEAWELRSGSLARKDTRHVRVRFCRSGKRFDQTWSFGLMQFMLDEMFSDGHQEEPPPKLRIIPVPEETPR